METNDPPPTFEKLVEEVFMRPIRSVLIIDDQYPTLDDQLDLARCQKGNPVDNSEKNLKSWTSKVDQISNIINNFRKRRWLVDIHDGTIPSGSDWNETYGHLHHSDLLILDYQLEGESLGGEKCLKIIRHLAQIDQFNLTIVYTENERPDNVFNEILLYLLPPCPKLSSPDERVYRSLKLWDEEDPEILERLVATVDDVLYIAARKNFNDIAREVSTKGGGRLGEYLAVFDSKPDSVKLEKTALLKWLLANHQAKIARKLSEDIDAAIPTWGTGGTGENWIRTDKVFITVSSKRETQDLPETLHAALMKWSPYPPRLILSKLRNELAATGVCAEDTFLRNTDLQVAWYHSLLLSSPDEQKHRIQETIRNYWSGISRSIDNQITAFTSTLLVNAEDAGLDADKVIERHFKRIPSSEAKLRLNAHNCSMPPQGYHLAPGHIIKRSNVYWLCLSPSCDLVPGQKQTGRFGRLKSTMPFKAVQLTKSDPHKALARVNDNCQIFIEIDDQIEAFRFLPIPMQQKEKGENASDGMEPIPLNPVWDELYAKGGGRIPVDGPMELEFGQLHCDDDLGGEISAVWETGVIVGQLRYEYAINLMQRLGYSLSRVGLDFVS